MYNDLGQAVLKSMHQTATMKKPAFYVGYKFHLHGMLTEVNNRLFTQQISYDKRQDGTTGYLNGNVSELFHRFDDKSDTDWRGQNFTYDHLNRFKSNGNVLANNGTTRVWNNTETLNYDPNGNILGLTRSKEGLGGIDALDYTYRNGGNSNILATIGDGASPTLGFKARGSNAYSFDVNGNLLTDANKGISTPITYNYLDLPTQVTVPDENGTSRTLSYTYDATGQKLAMLVNGTTDRTFYTGEIEYNNNALPTRIHTPMGYISRDADDLWQYTYNLKDFQGSVRVTAKYDPETKLAVTTQKTDFYVLGLPLRYDTENFNRYLYQDKEQQPYSEFFDFGWRQYDPLVGRWFNNDPADQFSSISPYAYVRNNPLMYVDPDGAFSFQSFWNGVRNLVNCNIIPFVSNNLGGMTGGYGLAAVGRAAQDVISNENYGSDIFDDPGKKPKSQNALVNPNQYQFLEKGPRTNIVPKDPVQNIKPSNGYKFITGTVAFIVAMASPANYDHPVSADGTPAGMIPSGRIKANLTDEEYTEFQELVRAISKGKALLPQDVERYKELFEKANRDTNLLPAKPKSADGLGRRIHHMASNKNNSKYTKEFKKIADKYKLSLDGDWNKIHIST